MSHLTTVWAWTSAEGPSRLLAEPGSTSAEVTAVVAPLGPERELLFALLLYAAAHTACLF